MIELKNVSKVYQSKKNKVIALNNISFTLGNNGMTFILGKSGSGKSTLLNLLGGLDSPSNGEITIDNKSMNSFSNQDYDSYRNTYIGFVFQDFNLIEDYNVYENIILPLKLQKQIIDETKIDNLLKELELTEFKFRKINELSGGQKGRVAIARALIKDPKIILADEPTGNLDSETGKQIFNLLKEISKNRLVIVVSHDQESANIYGNRIIEIKDGNVINNSNPINEKNHDISKISLKQSKLPLKDSLFLGMKSLKHKKSKLVLSIILTSMALMFLGITFSLATFDVIYSEMNLLTKHKIDRVQIDKRHNVKDDIFYATPPLNQKDIDTINQKLNRKSFPIYKFNHPSTEYIENALRIKMPEFGENDSVYINSTPIEFIELEQASNISEQIIGSFPVNNNELLISNYLADLMIMRGIEVKDENNNTILFQPKTYEEIVNSNYLFYLDELENMKISGIIKYDLSKYEPLKNIIHISGDSEEETKYNDIILGFDEYAEIICNKIYVKKGFIQDYNLGIGNSLDDSSLYELKIPSFSLKDPLLYQVKYGFINEMIEYYDGEKWFTTNKLNKNEVIFNVKTLTDLNSNDYHQKLQNYYAENPTRPKNELEKEFFASYISKYKSLIGKNVKLEITKNNEQTFDNLKIIGLIGLDDTYRQDKTLFSKELMKDYISSTFYTSAIFVNKLNNKELKNIIKDFPLGETYSFNTIYSRDAYKFIESINLYRKIAFYLSLVFLFFSILLISNFVTTNINYKKKDIGILRALGARKKDIIKIFLWEGIVLIITSIILSSIMTIYASKWMNHWRFSSNPLIFEPFVFTINTFLFLLFIVTIIVLIASILPINKISKMKPVDAIFNR